MEVIGDVLKWATGSLEGVAFVEYLILIAVAFMWRRLNQIDKRIDKHEDECTDREKATAERFAEGSKKMALLDQRMKTMQTDIREIKQAVQK